MNTDSTQTAGEPGAAALVGEIQRPRVWPVLGRVAFFWLVYALVLVLGLGGTLAGAAPRGWQMPICGVVASLGTMVFTWWLLGREGWRLRAVGLGWERGSIGRFFAGVGLGIVLYAVMAGISAALGGMRWERAPDVGLAAFGMQAVTFLAVGSMEELGFRAYPLRRLEPVLGLWGAQGVVAVVFGLGHYLQGWPWPAAFFGAGLGSLVFGMAAMASRGLALPIGLHAAGNLTDWMLGGKGPTGVWKVVVAEDAQGRSQFVGTFSYYGVMSAATAGFWWWHRHRLRAAAANLKTP